MTVPLKLRLSRVAALASGPVMLRQGRATRREIPRLPEAQGPRLGSVDGPSPLRMLVLGDSTSTGVGVTEMSESLAPRLADAVHARDGRGIDWEVFGRSGATAAEVLKVWLPQALDRPYDLVFLSIGANDALQLRSRGAFRRDVLRIVDALHRRNPRAGILLSSLPAFIRFESLPQPLRRNLYRHSQSLELTAREALDELPYAQMSPPPDPYTPGFFASDGFHPSASGYRDWAEFAVKRAPGWAPAGDTS